MVRIERNGFMENPNNFIALVDFSDSKSIFKYAKTLEGMTFQEVLDLDILPNGKRTKDFGNPNFKGGMGELIEERYFGYEANSNAAADFPEAGLELKATPFKILKNQKKTAKERLVLSMISYKEEFTSTNLLDSKFWSKNQNLLLIYYHGDKSTEKLQQKIYYVDLFTPTEEDLAIIRDDYRIIVDYIRSGRAHELSESLTTYLAACTKGSTAEKSWQDQAMYNPGTQAKRRAFSYKASYMTYILNNIIDKRKEPEYIVNNAEILNKITFEEYVLGKISQYTSKTEAQLCKELNVPYTKNKAQRTAIVFRMLGLKEESAAEFIKGNITVKTLLEKADGSIREHIPLPSFEFEDFCKESWDDSVLKNQLSQNRYLFVVFQEDLHGEVTLKGATFFGMPDRDIEGTVKQEWLINQKSINKGVTLTLQKMKGGVKVINSLPKLKNSSIVHLRPHATKSGYILKDGTRIGDPEKYGSQLPNGLVMTRQSFWLKNTYIANKLHEKGL